MRFTAGVFTAIALGMATASAQERKIEVSPYAGGYFSAGYASFHRVPLVGISPVGGIAPDGSTSLREFRPVDEPNSGIFGARASYDLTDRFSLEGTFGFSPAGRHSGSLSTGTWTFTSLSDFLNNSSVPSPSIRGGNTYQYSGNTVFHWRQANGWAPFLTGGLGAVQRTGRLVVHSSTPLVLIPCGSTTVGVLASSTTFPSPNQTDFSVNFGGGVKKYFSERWGIRFDFRDYISSPSGDTVNNMEVSLGLVFKM